MVTLAQSVQFQFIKLNVVREYLYLEFKDLQLPFKFDFERIIDDFVFLCFFVGNDFLPHSPSLHIREGAIDAILAIYKQQLPSLGDYLTDTGKIDFNRLDLILNDLGKVEEVFIRQKKDYEERQKANAAAVSQGANPRGGY
jgi:5'-3' exoribonuclease 2